MIDFTDWKVIVNNLENISIAYVALLQQKLPKYPMMNNLEQQKLWNRFCKDLFEKPYETVNGFYPDGYLVSANTSLYPALYITNDKVVCKTKNKEDLSNYLCKLNDFLKKNDPEILKNFRAFGLNYEYKIDLNDVSSFLIDRFCSEKIKTSSDRTVICNSISLSVVAPPSQRYNFQIQTKDNTCFIEINHHHEEIFTSLHSGKDLLNIIAESQTSVENILKGYFEK